MTWRPISGAPVQYQASDGSLASGYYLKFYQSGTTTAISMATDSTGGTTLAKCQLNASGYPINGSSDVFIPHVNQKYKIVLYTNSTDADADTTGNADWVIDAVDQTFVDEWNTGYTASRSDTDTFTIAGQDVTSVFTAGRAVKLTGGADRYAIISSSSFSTDTTVDVVLITDNSGASSTLHASMDTAYLNILTSISLLGDAMIGFVQSNSGGALTGATARTVHTKLQEFISVKDFGAVGDGVTDDTSAIQAAIDSGDMVIFPEGTYLVTATILVNRNRVHLIGAGMYATTILFSPTANDTCFYVSAGASVIYQGSIRDMSIYSNDSTYEKIAIDVVDHSGYHLYNIAIAGSVAVSGASLWSGGAGGSTALSLKGREFGLFKNLYIAADLPITINGNPNSTIDIDHHVFTDTYLTGNITQPLITIADGVNLTNVTFNGAQAWVRGSYGLYWSDTTTSSVSLNLSIQNMRTEQGGVSSDYSVYIDHNTGLHGFEIKNTTHDSAREGIYLRNVDNTLLSGIETAGTPEVLNVDSTCRSIHIQNCFWQAGSTASMTGQRLLWSTTKYPTTGPLAPNAIYEIDTSLATRNIIIGGAIGQESFTLANDGIQTLGETTMGGVLIVTDSEYYSAIYNIKGTNNDTDEVSDPSGIYSDTAGTASMTNIYWNGATSRYELENKRGASRTYRISFFGTYSSGF